LILPDSLESEEPEVRKTMETGERLEQFETRRLRKDGKELNVSLTVSPLRNAEGRIIGTASIERDITRRKQSQHRLQEAIVAAEKANQAKTEFLANISHELRTPMNAILGMTNLALQEELSDVVRDYLITARDSADTMLFLINDILDFSRLEAERFELDNAPFDVRHMLEETMRLLSLRAHEKGLELVTRISPDVPTRIVGDVMRVRQILTNLIGNAIKFTETGEVVASVSLAAADHTVAGETWNPGDEVSLLFCVRDTGIGISPEDQDRIFAPFAQADASTTRTYAGTGLGLSICQALVKLMDGRLWVESQLDVGSRFYFSSHFEVAATAEEDHTLSIDIDDLRDTQVLIVDDNESNLQTLKTMLEAWEMRPVLANNAEAAIELLEAATREGNGFSLLLVDAVMPHRDGVELLEAIEESTATAGATVLMLSPADQPVFRYRTEKLHVGAVLDKPVSQSGLLNAIAQAFGDVAFVQSPHAPINAIAHPLRVLVAEDIAANQKVIETILARRGHVVTVAHNGRDAITLHQQQTFDSVLMDIQMPIMDGLQAVRAIRERESEGEHIPVIAMTAHAMRGDREACLQAGMDAYVSKPIDAASLLTTLEEIAGRSPGVHTGERTSAQREPDAEPGLQRAEDDVEATDSAVWNPAVALKRLGDDKSLLVNLIDFFFEDSTRLQEQLPDAISAGDAREVTRLAHSLKGLCSNFEAAAATAAASEIEEAGRAGQLGLAAAGLADLDLRLDQLRGELALWQSGPTP
jgi:two-component system sensor histidine kinase/response regulator